MKREKKEMLAKKKKMGFYIFITENSTKNVVATHVALSLPVVTVKVKIL